MRIARELIAFDISISCPGSSLVIGPFSDQFFFSTGFQLTAGSTKDMRTATIPVAHSI